MRAMGGYKDYNTPGRPSRNSSSPARKLSAALASGEDPHTAALRSSPSAEPMVVGMVTDALTRHSLANHPGLRLAEPNVPDGGAKYLVVVTGTTHTPIRPLNEALDALCPGAGILVMGSGRPICMMQPSRNVIVDYRGASVLEMDTILKWAARQNVKATDAGNARSESMLRIRASQSDRVRIVQAAEFERIRIGSPIGKGKYMGIFMLEAIIERVERVEGYRARLGNQ